MRQIEPLTKAAYQFFEWREQQTQNKGEAVADPWHLSFHGSQFPGDDPKACGRQALYTMMDIPRGPMSRMLRTTAESGKDIEDRLVLKWYYAGYLMSPPPPPIGDYQMQFEESEAWLTSTVDSIVLPPWANRGAVVEVKSKWASVIEEMIRLYRGPDPKHVKQVKAQIALAARQPYWTAKRCYNSGRLAIKLPLAGITLEICPEHGHDKCLREERLERVEYGFLYYVSRDNPMDTWEYYFDLDQDFYDAGIVKLKRWAKSFQDDVLPQDNFNDKRFSHPLGDHWRWTEMPCKWCDYGQICREDHRTAVKQRLPIKLSESAAIQEAKDVNEGYDVNLVRAAVLQRWGLKSDQS